MKLTVSGDGIMNIGAARGWVLIMVMLLLVATGCGRREAELKKELIRPVKLLTIKDPSAALSLGMPGAVRASRRAILSFKVSGPLVELPIEEGRSVKEGDLIAQIQKRDFENAVNQALARYRESEQQFRRYKELYSKKQVSQADYDRYRALRDVAKAQLEDAQNALRDTTLQAPFDGVIAKRFVDNWQKVKPTEPIVSLQDISRIEILVDVPELFIAEIRDNHSMKIMARFESIPGKEAPLEVKEYSTEADPATQTYQIVLVMDQPPEANILPGMTATITATYQGNYDQGPPILVPAIAVLDAPGNHPYVWLFESGEDIIRKREVKIGDLEGSADIRILAGLEPGEEIAVAGVAGLSDGMKVRPWKKQGEEK